MDRYFKELNFEETFLGVSNLKIILCHYASFVFIIIIIIIIIIYFRNLSLKTSDEKRRF